MNISNWVYLICETSIPYFSTVCNTSGGSHFVFIIIFYSKRYPYRYSKKIPGNPTFLMWKGVLNQISHSWTHFGLTFSISKWKKVRKIFFPYFLILPYIVNFMRLISCSDLGYLEVCVFMYASARVSCHCQASCCFKCK